MIVCYAQPEKLKSRMVLEAFAMGCGAEMASTHVQELLPGAAVFYGVRPPWMHLWHQAKREGREWWYIDNAWFDRARERFFRIGHNAVQSWAPASDGARLQELGIEVQPWRRRGRNIIVCPQTDEFMRTVARDPSWRYVVKSRIAAHTDRPIVERVKGSKRPLAEDLVDAWLLVAHSSAAAVEALLAGVPVIVTDPSCAAAAFATSFEGIESPVLLDGREEWAARLADSQWTLEEMKKGAAWKAMNR